jgi:hypothetical protein
MDTDRERQRETEKERYRQRETDKDRYRQRKIERDFERQTEKKERKKRNKQTKKKERNKQTKSSRISVFNRLKNSICKFVIKVAIFLSLDTSYHISIKSYFTHKLLLKYFQLQKKNKNWQISNNENCQVKHNKIFLFSLSRERMEKSIFLLWFLLFLLKIKSFVFSQ